MTWVPVLWTLMCIIMLFGACAGSTSGGIKCIRIAIMSRDIKKQFKRIIHPNAVLPVRINRQVNFFYNQIGYIGIYFPLYSYCLYWLAIAYDIRSRI